MSRAAICSSDIFVVIPSFNEASAVLPTLQPLLRSGYEIIIVDDASTDRTREALLGTGVHYLRHPINLGQGAALQTGMDYALRLGAGIIVHFDADGQHPAGQIPELIEPIRRGDADVCLGSRFLDPACAALVPRGKRLLLRAGTVVSWLFTGLLLTDTHNGFRALSREAAQRIRLREDGFSHATEILAQIRAAGLRYREVPVQIRYDEYSRAKGQRMWNSINIVYDLIIRRLFG